MTDPRGGGGEGGGVTLLRFKHKPRVIPQPIQGRLPGQWYSNHSPQATPRQPPLLPQALPLPGNARGLCRNKCTCSLWSRRTTFSWPAFRRVTLSSRLPRPSDIVRRLRTSIRDRGIPINARAHRGLPIRGLHFSRGHSARNEGRDKARGNPLLPFDAGGSYPSGRPPLKGGVGGFGI